MHFVFERKKQKFSLSFILKKNCEPKKSATLCCALLQGSISSTYLRGAFTIVAPQSVRTQSSHRCLFMLLGTTHVKVVRRMLMKLSPVRDAKFR